MALTPSVFTASRLVLDTSAYSHMRAGNAAVLDALSRAEVVVMTTTVLGELAAAFESGSKNRESNMILNQFLEEPFVLTRSVTKDVARHYGKIHARLRRTGTPIPINDVWIAAATVDCGGHLLTFDRDFARVEGLDATILTVP